MKDFLSSYEIDYIVQAAYAILVEDRISQGDTQPAFADLTESRKTSFTEFVKLIIANPDADLSKNGFGLSWLIQDEDELIIKAVLGMAATFKSIDKTPIKSGFEELKTDADLYSKTRFSLSFVDYLRCNFSLNNSEKYSQLIAKVNIEKYSPYSSKENQSEILNEIEEVYNKL